MTMAEVTSRQMPASDPVKEMRKHGTPGGPVSMFTFPSESINGRDFSFFYPAGPGGIDFNLVQRQVNTNAASTAGAIRTFELPSHRDTGPLAYMSVVCDVDSLLYLSGSNPIYIPGGRPTGIPIDGVDQFRLLPNWGGSVGHDIIDMSITFGVMVTFANAKAASLLKSGIYQLPIPQWQRITLETGNTVSADQAAGTRNSWTHPPVTVPYNENIDNPAPSFTDSDADLFTVDDGWLRTNHLVGPVQVHITSADEVVKVRIQGGSPLGSLGGTVKRQVVDDPSTQEGIIVDTDQPALIVAHHMYPLTRVLVAVEQNVTQNNTTAISMMLTAPMRGN